LSSIETKTIVAKNLYQFAYELQTLVQAGWVIAEGGIRNNTVTYRASLVRGVSATTEEVVKDEVVKDQSKTTKTQTPKVVKTEVKKDE